MRKHLGTLLVAWMVLTALPAQAHAGWFTCENGDWEWSWQFWNWGCECDAGWETTPSPWIDQCTTHIDETCANGGARYDYICFWPGSNISSDRQCEENDANLESRCDYYDQWETPFTVSGPGDGWYYKACPTTHICVDEKFDFNSVGANPCNDLDFTMNTPADRPCGPGNITTY